MASLVCPSCGAGMEKGTAADITTDLCPSCGGVFLDKQELNALATGMAGDIECLSIDKEVHVDRFPQRSCPKCADQPMEKVNLLRLSGIVFDHCASCGGFFLDKGEIEAVNRELKTMTPNQEAEEYREMHGDHLVRIDRSTDVMQADYLGITQLIQSCYIRVSVFFKEDLPTGLHVSREKWPVRLAKAMGIMHRHDVHTGDEHFDAAFHVSGDDPDGAARHLDPAARAAIMAFTKSKRSVCGTDGALEITPSAVVYVEGPCDPKVACDLMDKAAPLVDELIVIAKAVEAVA